MPVPNTSGRQRSPLPDRSKGFTRIRVPVEGRSFRREVVWTLPAPGTSQICLEEDGAWPVQRRFSGIAGLPSDHSGKPSFCVAFQHGSRILWILARVSQPGLRIWASTAPKGVCMGRTGLSRGKAFSSWTQYPTLADPCVTAWWASLHGGRHCLVGLSVDHCVAWCALLKQLFFQASVLAHCFFS